MGVNISDIKIIQQKINNELEKNGFNKLYAQIGPDNLIFIKVTKGDWRKVHWHLHILIGSLLKECGCTFDYAERSFGKYRSGLIYNAVHEIRIEGMVCFDTLSRDRVKALKIPCGIADISLKRERSKNYKIDEETGDFVKK